MTNCEQCEECNNCDLCETCPTCINCKNSKICVNCRKNNSCRGCQQKLVSQDPQIQYAQQKVIQNTVRVPSSLYTMNLGALSSYNKPSPTGFYVKQSGSIYYVPPGIRWNQMSDQSVPSIQQNPTVSGSAYRGNSTRRSIVRHIPGSLSPGGSGCDIKHNSYERYLNRIKGKGPLRSEIMVNNNYNIKTSIITGCHCN